MTHLNEALVEDLFGELEIIPSRSPRVISKLQTLLPAELGPVTLTNPTDRILCGLPGDDRHDAQHANHHHSDGL